MKINSTKGFTLIELMVVIAIIGILATAGITTYSSQQAKSRDTVRLQNIVWARTLLQDYYSDNWQYPEPQSPWCLSNEKWVAHNDFQPYVSGKLSLDPQATNKSLPCNQNRALWYEVLTRNWVEKSAYVVTTNTETKQKSNFCYPSPTRSNNAINVDTVIDEGMKTQKGTCNANQEIYISIN